MSIQLRSSLISLSVPLLAVTAAQAQSPNPRDVVAEKMPNSIVEAFNVLK